MSLFKKAVGMYRVAGQKVGAMLAAPTKTQAQLMMLGAAVVVLTAGMNGIAHAASGGSDGVELEYNDDKIATAVKAIFTFLEGSFGALVMVVAGLGAIMSAAFGQYKAALGCLVVAVGAFILRSFVYTFFNTETIEGGL